MEEAQKNQSAPPEPPKFHTPGVTWRYTDGTRLIVQPDGSVRRSAPKPPSKKDRRKARAKKTVIFTG